MKKVLSIIIVFLIIFVGYIKFSSSHDQCGPNEYSSIQELEQDLDIDFYPLYDLETFILEDRLVPLNDQKDHIGITGSKEKNTISYTFYDNDSAGYLYEVSFNSPLNRTAGATGIDICDGTLYQYDTKDNEKDLHIAIFKKDNFELYLSFDNTDDQIDTQTLENKIIAYIEAVC